MPHFTSHVIRYLLNKSKIHIALQNRSTPLRRFLADSSSELAQDRRFHPQHINRHNEAIKRIVAASRRPLRGDFFLEQA